MVETSRKEATTTEEGWIQYTCERCGATTTETIQKVKEVIDIAALEAYGRQYAKSLGYEICIGLRDGYYPGLEEYICTMGQGKEAVRGNVDATTNHLIARGCEIAKEMEDGTIGRARFDIKIEYLRENWYFIRVYYG